MACFRPFSHHSKKDKIMTIDPFRWLRIAAYLVLLCLCVALLQSAHAQTAVIPYASPTVQFLDGDGNPLASGCVFTYQAGTTTPQSTYSESTGTTPNANPIILSASGEATIWMGMSAYEFVVKSFGGTGCASGSTIRTIDNVSEKFIRTDAGNVMVATVDPAASLGLFWLSSTTAGFLKWSDASAIHTIVGADSPQTLTNKTLTSPIINGTPTGTGIPTFTQKKGTGLGNYTGANTSAADVDAANLSYTVTIPTGWKLWCGATFNVFQSTAAGPVMNFLLADGGIALAGTQDVVASAVNMNTPVAINTVVTGDGASHTIRIQAATNNAADSWNMENATATRTPILTCILSPSN